MVELGFIPRVVGPQTYILSLLTLLNEIHHTEATEQPQVVPQPPFPRGCLIEPSGPGKTWARPDEHSNWGHPRVTVVGGFPRRYILGSPPPRLAPGSWSGNGLSPVGLDTWKPLKGQKAVKWVTKNAGAWASAFLGLRPGWFQLPQDKEVSQQASGGSWS